MASTTIKVSRDLHARLADAASQAGLTLGDYIDQLMRERERAARFGAIREARMRTDMRGYDQEVAGWDSTLGDGLEQW